METNDFLSQIWTSVWQFVICEYQFSFLPIKSGNKILFTMQKIPIIVLCELLVKATEVRNEAERWSCLSLRSSLSGAYPGTCNFSCLCGRKTHVALFFFFICESNDDHVFLWRGIFI